MGEREGVKESKREIGCGLDHIAIVIMIILFTYLFSIILHSINHRNMHTKKNIKKKMYLLALECLINKCKT